MTLTLESRFHDDQTPTLGLPDGSAVVMITPPIDPDYWAYRVKLSDTQAIVGFPKFGTIGIGFAQETDWNTNLPYTVDTEKLFQHIAENKGDDAISDDDVRQAITLVQLAAATDKAAGLW